MALQILRVKKAFDDANGRVMFLDGFAQGLGNFDKAAGAFPAGRAGNGAVRQGFRKRLGQFDDAEAGAAQRRVHAENDAMRIGSGAQCRRKNRRDRAGGSAAEAFLHLFKLPPRDAHQRILPAAAGLQKKKRRALLARHGVSRIMQIKSQCLGL